MRPELKWWGDELPVLRYNLIISLALGVSFVLRRMSLREMVPVRNPTLYWLCAMGATMVLVTATVAVNQQISLDWMIQWHKMAIIFPLLLVGVIRSRQGFNAFVVVNMLGAFWWGWEAYTDPKRSAGRLVNIGSGDSLDDNAAAAHLLTVLPMIFIYVVTEKDKLLKGVALLAAPFVVNTLILCNSRGSIVGLGVAGILRWDCCVRGTGCAWSPSAWRSCWAATRWPTTNSLRDNRRRPITRKTVPPCSGSPHGREACGS